MAERSLARQDGAVAPSLNACCFSWLDPSFLQYKPYVWLSVRSLFAQIWGVVYYYSLKPYPCISSFWYQNAPI